MGFTRVSELFSGRRSVSFDQISLLARLRRGQDKDNSSNNEIISTSPNATLNASQASGSEPPQLTLTSNLGERQPFANVIERNRSCTQLVRGFQDSQIDLSVESFRHRISSSESEGIWSCNENDTNTNNSSTDGIGYYGHQNHSDRPLEVVFHSPYIVPPRHPPLCARDPERSILRASQTDPNIQALHDRTSPTDTEANTSTNIRLTNARKKKPTGEEGIDLLNTSARALRRMYLPPISWDPDEPESEPASDEQGNPSNSPPTSASEGDIPPATPAKDSQYLCSDPSTPMTGSVTGSAQKSSSSKKTVRFDRIDVHTYTQQPPYCCPAATSRSIREAMDSSDRRYAEVNVRRRDVVQESNSLFSPSDYGRIFGPGN